MMTTHFEPPDLETPMQLDPEREAMHELGGRVIELIAAHRCEVERKPVHRHAARGQLDALLAEPPPQAGMPISAVLDLVEQCVLNAIAHTDHPRFFGYVPSPGNFVSAMGDAIASGFNVFAGHALVGSGPAAIEAITLGWLRSLMGFPSSASGIFVSGGSVANLTAIHTARTHLLGRTVGHDPSLVVYATTQQHASLPKALRILGFSAGQYRLVSTTSEGLTLDIGALRAAIASDRRSGRRPFLIAVTAGATSTGIVDPLRAVRRVCDDEGLWMHVDGAYGNAAWLDSQSRPLLDGIASADSLVLDPHKWWFQPYEIGCVLVRRGDALRQAFAVEAEYLREAHGAATDAAADPLSGVVNFYDLGPQLTRSFRALKLWMFLKANGIPRLTKMVQRGIAMAAAAQDEVVRSPHFELVTPASLGILTFRFRDSGLQDAEHVADAVDALLATGYALITTTEIKGERVFRLCPIHPHVSLAHVRRSLDLLAGDANSTRLSR
jgi:aromatic-L-amino-acid/L-tryptophan decarboxylase